MVAVDGLCGGGHDKGSGGHDERRRDGGEQILQAHQVEPFQREGIRIGRWAGQMKMDGRPVDMPCRTR
ncbi:hypothetical protein GCM10018781_78240 [Kitasatospora indigofera]|uniref:Uncharacterized protein n=1 Tax=Kitasatospora indigofera TaxID=67307 RepID=A0A919D934_9ACTN|nr:hypothetical protein GCM10018781_78240 [Kitasatospora indigofera]